MSFSKISAKVSRRSAIVALAVLCGVIAVTVFATLGWKAHPGAHSRYSIVQFRTGEVYFGELHWLPRPHLSRVWILERSVNGGQPVTAVNPITKAPWKPLDVLYFNPSELVAWSPLASDSPFAAAFNDPDALAREAGGPSTDATTSTLP
jgi:hypothetical protein